MLILRPVFAELARWIVLAPGDLFHTVTYTRNYHATRSWNVGRTWSLSVEEQFYLLWPALLVPLGGRRAIWLAALFVLAAPLIRLELGIVLSGPLGQHPRIDFFVGFTLRNVLVALCIDRWVSYPSGPVGRVLNSRPFIFVGLISYSIYLWQQRFLNRYATSLPTSFPRNIVLAIAAALASYYLVERPALRLRQRIERALFPARAGAARAERRTLHPEAERPASAA